MTELFELEADPVPIVKIIGAQMRRALRRPDYRRRASKFRGCIALASDKDPQALTIRGDGGGLRVARGVADDAALILRLDFERIAEPRYSPKVEGLFRHPLLALRTARLLNFPRESWPDAARRFWDQTRNTPRMPRNIRVHCEDDGHEIKLGDEDETEVEIYGSARALADLFSGSTVLVQEVMKRQIRIVSSFEHIAVLSGHTLNLMLGEIEGE